MTLFIHLIIDCLIIILIAVIELFSLIVELISLIVVINWTVRPHISNWFVSFLIRVVDAGGLFIVVGLLTSIFLGVVLLLLTHITLFLFTTNKLLLWYLVYLQKQLVYLYLIRCLALIYITLLKVSKDTTDIAMKWFSGFVMLIWCYILIKESPMLQMISCVKRVVMVMIYLCGFIIGFVHIQVIKILLFLWFYQINNLLISIVKDKNHWCKVRLSSL